MAVPLSAHQVDPGGEWAALTLREEELAVSDLLPCSLADSHHHVRMLAATSVDRCVRASGCVVARVSALFAAS